MKKVSKLLAVLLAATMMLAICTTALAANDKNDGSITINNATAGKVYTIYKVFDMSYATESAGSEATDNDSNLIAAAYSYTTSATAVTYDEDTGIYTVAGDDLLAALLNGYSPKNAGENEEEDTIEYSTPFNLQKTAVSNVYNVTLKENESLNSIVTFLTALVKDKVLTTTIDSKTAESEQVKFENLDYGYYYITSSVGSVVSLTSTTPAAMVVDKNYVPFDKTDDDDSVEVGQTVKYTLTGEVPDYTGFKTYTYKITDTMSEGLTFNKDVVVKVGGTALTENNGYTVSYTDDSDASLNGFVLNIKVLDNAMKVGEKITVTYSATVNEKAVSVISKNNAKLEYSNDPTNEESTTTIEKEETVYSAKISIDKYDSENESTKLAGAKFVLYRYATATTQDDITTYSFCNEAGVAYTADDVKDGSNIVPVYYTYDEAKHKVSWVADQGNAAIKTTDANGAADFIGLEDGTYYLLETAAPEGYNLLEEAVKIEVSGKDATATDKSTLTVTEKVENSTGAQLPTTGGMGTTVFYILGAALVVGAGVVLVVRRRMDAEL